MDLRICFNCWDKRHCDGSKTDCQCPCRELKSLTLDRGVDTPHGWSNYEKRRMELEARRYAAERPDHAIIPAVKGK